MSGLTTMDDVSVEVSMDDGAPVENMAAERYQTGSAHDESFTAAAGVDPAEHGKVQDADAPSTAVPMETDVALGERCVQDTPPHNISPWVWSRAAYDAAIPTCMQKLPVML